MAKPAAVSGQGKLTFSGFTGAVDYEFKGDDKRRNGKGLLTADADDMRRAFRAGQAALQFDDGVSSRITIVAHSEGDRRAFFEIETPRH